MKHFLLWMALMMGLPHVGIAAGLIVLEDKGFPAPISPIGVEVRPRPPSHFPWRALETVSTRAEVRIRDQVATVSMEQEFYNPNDRTCEGTFLFPVPAGAHLDRFVLMINGKETDAELLTAEKARKIYEDIVRRAEDPALLEYVGRDLYKVRIYPIEARSRRQIKLSYSQLLKEESGLVSWVLPLRSTQSGQAGAGKLSVSVALESTVPIRSLYSPSHKIEVRRQGDLKAAVTYEGTVTGADGDLQLYFSRSRSELGMDLLTFRSGEEDGYFLLLANPEVDAPSKRVQPKDMVFVLDASGSMSGPKLEQARKALKFCVENLNEQDRFQILRFSTEVDPAFQDLRLATSENRAEATQFVERIRSSGGTAIHDALVKALALKPAGSERPFVVVFLTDGLPTVGITDPGEILKAVTGGRAVAGNGVTRIFCFGIGTDVNTHLLDQITEFTKASSTYVLPTEDLEIKLSSFFSRIKDPALSNVELALPDGVRPSGIHPNPLPDLYKGQQILVVGRYAVGKAGDLVLSGQVQGEKRSFKRASVFPDRDLRNEWLPRLWATRRVGFLLDEIRLRGESSELKDEVVVLAKKYAIVTPYTAYLVSEDEGRRGVTVQRQLLKLSSDAVLQDSYRQQYRALTREKSGDMAVAGARSFSYLKEANAPDAGISQIQTELSAAVTAPSPLPSAPASSARVPAHAARMRVPQRQNSDAIAPQARFVGGKSFFQKGEQWVDAETQGLGTQAPVAILFGSADYFDLLHTHPEARVWLSVGRNLQIVIAGKLYAIQ